MPQSSASPPVIASPTTPPTAAVCPYLLAADGRWRSASPARDHRCTAVVPATIVALEKQRRMCLTAAHGECATFTAADAGRAEDDERPARIRRRAVRAVPRTAPLILDHGRSPVHIGPVRERGLAQAALLVLMGAAFAAIVIARLSGSPIEGGVLAGAGGPSATAARSATPSDAASPTVDDRTASAAPATEPSAVAAPTSDASVTPPADGEPSEPPATIGPTTYTVRAGDTLSGIAAVFGTTVAALAELNGIEDPSRLAIGQELELPPAD